jgi:hypothetical protein
MTDSPVVHIVLVRWKSGFRRADLEELTALADAFPETIPGVLAVHCGPSTSPEGKEGGFDWALVVTFASSSARDEYLPHPAHEPVKRLLSQWADEVVVFDLDA